MNTKNLLIIIGILALIVVGLYLNSKRADRVPVDAEQVACTADAKMCPDGSFVGRIGPNCEFAACPSSAGQEGGQLSPAGINRSVTGLGVTITPLNVLEDSRCPVGVTCIQAGIVRLSAKVRLDQQGTESAETFVLGVPVSIMGGTITLEKVSPSKTQNDEILPSQYEFVFKVEGIEFLAEKG